ncbi:MAG: nucleotidyltransferase, partial [Dysgonamonadaceae bacterium]
LIVKDKAKVKVLDTTSQWFGITYQEDRPWVVSKLKELVDNGEYPSPLF